MVLLTLLAIVMVGVARARNLFAVIILAAIYSFLIASVMVVLDAVDVAMTEAAVGAGVSTVLLLAAMTLTRTREREPGHRPILPLFVSGVTAAALIYATFGLPPFGSAYTPVHEHVKPYYIENSVEQTTVPNVVTSVLASYRGFDTLGELTVIFTAGIAIVMLLASARRLKPGSKGGRQRR